ncbi:MAG: OmpH family outer membrane protein [Roseobacter sp.]
MWRGLAAVCLVWALSAFPVKAQQAFLQSPVLTVDSERLYAESNYGQNTTREIETRGAELAAENRRIEEELSREEQDLTAQRATLPAADFRDLANAFDEKVQDVRRAQDAKARELNRLLEQRQVAFLTTAGPVLEQLMREAGAAVILERRSIFLSANAIDITQEAIDRLNKAGITGPMDSDP